MFGRHGTLSTGATHLRAIEEGVGRKAVRCARRGKVDGVLETGIAAYPNAAHCRTTPYIFLLTECWNFRHSRTRVKSVGRLPKETPPDPLPAGLTVSERLVHTTK